MKSDKGWVVNKILFKNENYSARERERKRERQRREKG